MRSVTTTQQAQRPEPWRRHRAFAWAPVLLALVIVLFPRSALASAPMCDPTAASVPAPLPAPPSATGDLSVPPRCPLSLQRGELAAERGEDAPPEPSATVLTERLLPTEHHLPTRAGSRQAIPPGGHAVRREGFGGGIYRPPRV